MQFRTRETRWLPQLYLVVGKIETDDVDYYGLYLGLYRRPGQKNEWSRIVSATYLPLGKLAERFALSYYSPIGPVAKPK